MCGKSGCFSLSGSRSDGWEGRPCCRMLAWGESSWTSGLLHVACACVLIGGCGCALARCLGLIGQNDRQMDERRQGRSKESVMAELKESFAYPRRMRPREPLELRVRVRSLNGETERERSRKWV